MSTASVFSMMFIEQVELFAAAVVLWNFANGTWARAGLCQRGLWPAWLVLTTAFSSPLSCVLRSASLLIVLFLLIWSAGVPFPQRSQKRCPERSCC